TVLYGDNASCGVINIVTKKGYESSESPFRIGTELGSYQYEKSFVSTGGTAKQIDYFFNYTHQQSSGYRANNDYWSNDYFSNLSFSIADQLSLEFSTGYHRDRYGMPGALFASDIELVGRRGTTHEDDKGWTSDYFVNVEPKITFSINDNDSEFSSAFSYRKRDNKSLSVSNWGRYETLHQIDSFELRPKFQMKSMITQEMANDVTVGLDYFYAKDKVRSGNQSSNQDRVNIIKQTFGLYALENVEIKDKFLISLGGRATWADYDFDQTAVSVNQDSKSITDGALNFGLGYKYNKDSQLFFDYSRSFRLPVTDEYYQNVYTGFWGSGGGLNTDLKHQVAHNYEFGIRDVSLPWLFADANIFLMDVDHEIYYDPITYKNSNYEPQTRHYGFELSSRLKFFKELLEPYINWTYQDAFFKGGTYAGNKVPFVPRNKISAGISLRPLDDLNTTFSMNYVDKCFAISDQLNGQAKLNSYITFDFKLDYQYKNVKFWFSVKNILDRMYDAYGVYSSGNDEVGFYPAQGRSFYSGVSFEF
ncbi:MAG: TonB-dependent receptor, partial [Candidatus Omnitrophica bacterium]|nr:TonB-dependent receptor [Candidatus Omnitrophota bacterium]